MSRRSAWRAEAGARTQVSSRDARFKARRTMHCHPSSTPCSPPRAGAPPKKKVASKEKLLQPRRCSNSSNAPPTPCAAPRNDNARRGARRSERPEEQRKSAFGLDLVQLVCSSCYTGAPPHEKERPIRMLRYYLSLVNQHRVASTRFKAVLSTLCCPYLRKFSSQQ